MRKQLLLAATLGALAIVPAPASAHDPAFPNVVSSFGVRIIVRDGREVVHHYHRPGGYLRPQPWPRHFGRPPIVRWHQPWHRHQMPHFPFRHGDHRSWFGGPGPRHVGPDAFGRWGHAPWHQDRPAFRHHVPHGGFSHGQPHSDRHRQRGR
jgi:hypothetical protein